MSEGRWIDSGKIPAISVGIERIQQPDMSKIWPRCTTRRRNSKRNDFVSSRKFSATFILTSIWLNMTGSYKLCIIFAVYSYCSMSELENHDLVEHVRQPTHRRGHQLDVFITRADDPVPSIRTDPPSLLSDHSLIVASFDDVIDTSAAAPERRRVQRRRWTDFDIDRFSDDLRRTELVVDPPRDVTELFDCYDDTLRHLIDIHAPEVTVTLYARPTAPWFDTECHLAKVKTRHLERMYRRKQDPASKLEWLMQFELQRDLFQSKFKTHWSKAIDSCGGDTKRMWRKLRCLLQPGDTSATDHSADDFARHFTMKVDNIRSSTAGAPPPVITSRTVSEPLASFEPVTADEVRRSLGRVPAKHCILDPVPTWLLKRVDGIIAPVIARMCNASFEQCSLPVKQKMAVTRPLLKKSSLDPNDLNSYRPISNLSFVSKMVERMVDSRLIVYTDRFDLIPVHQSAYRRYHSTETALVRLYNDMVQVIDRGHVGALVLLDISAAFDTVDHRIMSDVLRQRFDVCEDALAWFNSYFDDRTQVVSVGSARSQASSLSIGVPQGSVLGPRTYVVYAEDVQEIFELRQVSHHLFADDMQGHTSSKPQDALMITSALQECIVAVSSWCASKRLQLNAKKTEVLWFGSVANLRKVAHADRCLTIGPDIIPATRSRPWPRSILRHAPDHEGTHRSCVTNMFLPSLASSFDSGLSRARGYYTTCGSLCHISAGLLQCPARQPTGVNSGTTPTGPPCRGSSGDESGTAWPGDTCSAWAPLVADPIEDSVQAVSSRPPCHRWPITRLHLRTGDPCGGHPGSIHTPFGRETWSVCSTIKIGVVRKGILCCSTKGLE